MARDMQCSCCVHDLMVDTTDSPKKAQENNSMPKVSPRLTKEQLFNEFSGLKKVVAHSTGMALVGFDLNGVITYFGPGAEKIFGHKAETVVGLESFTLLHSGQDSDLFLRFLGSFHDDDESKEANFSVATKQGKSLPMLVTLSSVGHFSDQTTYLALYRDQTPLVQQDLELKQLREQVRFSQFHTEKEAAFLRELIRHTMETIRIGLVVQEAGSGMIAYTNEGFEHITGLNRLEVLGKTLGELFQGNEKTAEQFEKYIKKIIEWGGDQDKIYTPGNWEIQLPAGEKAVEVYGRLIAIEGHDNQFILLIIEDNTDRDRLQMKLVQSEKMAAIGQLAAGIAHEIRNPLTTIHNALFDLKEIIKNPCEEIHEDISISMEEIKRVQDIINNLLDFARESGGRLIGHCNVNAVVEKTLQLVQNDLSHHKIQIKWNPGVVDDVPINSNALKQILINLITNATHAMAQGGTLTLRSGIRLQSNSSLDKNHKEPNNILYHPHSPHKPNGAGSEPQKRVFLEVSDTGVGIPHDHLSDIFNPFFTTKDPGEGTGLGLSVVHSFIREAGGMITVDSQPSHGTTFNIELPISP